MSFATMFDADLARFRAAQEVLQELGTSNAKLEAALKELDAQQQLHIEVLAAERKLKKSNSITHKLLRTIEGLKKEPREEVIEQSFDSDEE